MTTRAGRAFKTLHNKIDLLEATNKDLLEACKYAISALTRLEQCGNHAPWVIDSYAIINKAISKAEGK